jgi:hypothetical protein
VLDQFRGEQLAYVAAFTVGSKLVFGDRPKDITIRWARLIMSDVLRSRVCIAACAAAMGTGVPR